MDKVAGLVFVHQAVEGVEAGVTQVFAVVQPQGGGVGEQDIEPALAEQVQPASAHPAVHLPLGVLMAAVLLVAHTAPQAQDADALVGVQLVLHADAALRGHIGVPVVVVAVDIEHRRVGKGDNKGQIPGVQIAAGED